MYGPGAVHGGAPVSWLTLQRSRPSRSLLAFPAQAVVCCFIGTPLSPLPTPSQMIPDGALSLPQSGHYALYSCRPFCERCPGPFAALDKLFSPSCDLHVLCVVLTSSQTT